MKSLLRFSIYFILLLNSTSLLSKEIAFTFDDSPRFATGHFDGPTRSKKLIKQLKLHNIQAAFFSVSKNIDQEGDERLKRYAKAGHIIANHTHTHPDFNKLTHSQYEDNFLQAHKSLQTYPQFKRWFRFPFLREGNTEKKRNQMRQTLKESNYFNAYITANNYDWHIESLYQKALREGKKVDLKKLRDFYVDVIIEAIEYYDKMAVKHLGRSPKHVLLLHEMDISALFIGELARELKIRKWKIIDPSDAFKDPISKYKAKKIFKYNPGRVAEIAFEAGQKKDLWHESCNETYLNKRFQKEVLD